LLGAAAAAELGRSSVVLAQHLGRNWLGSMPKRMEREGLQTSAAAL
jgi:hypothetical protein